MKTKHTPTPWGIERTTDGNWIGPIRKDSHKISEIVVHTDRDGLTVDALERNDANAAFIVHACNSHEALVAALRQIADLNPATDSDEGYNEWGEADCFVKAQGIARAALERGQ